MAKKLDRKWQRAVSQIDYACQPIVNIYTGYCFGFEALLRNFEKAGFGSIQAFFDTAYNDDCLAEVDLLLREKALAKFAQIPFHQKIKIFYNLDNRALILSESNQTHMCRLLERFNLRKSCLCFEISERHEFHSQLSTTAFLQQARQKTYKIAIDDFGAGYAGLQLLYRSEPDYIKIDRFFISGIAEDARKKLFIETIVSMAHTLSIKVIAEGVETVEEFTACREIGCDYVQGYLIQRPTPRLNELKSFYEKVAILNKKDRRKKKTDKNLIEHSLIYLDPLIVPDHDMKDLIDAFGRNQAENFLLVINQDREPLGIIRDIDLKEYVYSPYGKDILMNRSMGFSLMGFVKKIPVADVNNEIEKTLAIFTQNNHVEGVIITENNRYLGFLSATVLLNALHEKNIAVARDLNPLTKLPGNSLINEFIAKGIRRRRQDKLYVYFDFDNFKPFNDKYGFRLGDRAILMFGDILKEYASRHDLFVGHIGGDDFFAGKMSENRLDEPALTDIVKQIIINFKENVASLYDQEDRDQGYYNAVNRNGILEKFSLLTVSAALLFVERQEENLNEDDLHKVIFDEELGRMIANLKKEAKKAVDGTASRRLSYKKPDLLNEDCRLLQSNSGKSGYTIPISCENKVISPDFPD
ncbi:MAG: GGDEF domain-containing protein [Deltaproteobacteria bacterium]|nr:GGDEF domain-containing protein [Deltaproteobacteria bacterium]